MVEKLLRVCVAATERGAAAFLRALNGRRADCGHARWRRSDLVAWRSPRLTADMVLRGWVTALAPWSWGSIGMRPMRFRRLQSSGRCLQRCEERKAPFTSSP